MTKLTKRGVFSSLFACAALLAAAGQAQALQCTKACTVVNGQEHCELVCSDGSRWVPAPPAPR